MKAWLLTTPGFHSGDGRQNPRILHNVFEAARSAGRRKVSAEKRNPFTLLVLSWHVSYTSKRYVLGVSSGPFSDFAGGE